MRKCSPIFSVIELFDDRDQWFSMDFDAVQRCMKVKQVEEKIIPIPSFFLLISIDIEKTKLKISNAQLDSSCRVSRVLQNSSRLFFSSSEWKSENHPLFWNEELKQWRNAEKKPSSMSRGLKISSSLIESFYGKLQTYVKLWWSLHSRPMHSWRHTCKHQSHSFAAVAHDAAWWPERCHRCRWDSQYSRRDTSLCCYDQHDRGSNSLLKSKRDDVLVNS